MFLSCAYADIVFTGNVISSVIVYFMFTNLLMGLVTERVSLASRKSNLAACLRTESSIFLLAAFQHMVLERLLPKASAHCLRSNNKHFQWHWQEIWIPIILQHYLSLINPTGCFIFLSLQRGFFGSTCSVKVGGFGPTGAETKGAYVHRQNEMKQMNWLRLRLRNRPIFNLVHSSGIACVCVCRNSSASSTCIPTNSNRAEEAWLPCAVLLKL